MPRTTTFAVGKRRSRRPRWTLLAHRCGWCGKWRSVYDRTLAALDQPVSHGICEDCRREHFPETVEEAP